MARGRYVKPSFFTSYKVADLPALGRLLFQGLWCLADREGLLPDHAAWIKTQVLPYDKTDVEKLLTILADRGFICRYEANGERFIHVTNFKEHQSVHGKEPASKLPPCAMHGPCMADASPVPVSTNNNNPDNNPDPDEQSASPRHRQAFRAYENAIGTMSGPVIIAIRDMVDSGVPPEWFEAAATEAAEMNKRSWRYMKAILEHWRDHHFRCDCHAKRRDESDDIPESLRAIGEATRRAHGG